MPICVKLKNEEDLLMQVNNDNDNKHHLGGHWKFWSALKGCWKGKVNTNMGTDVFFTGWVLSNCNLKNKILTYTRVYVKTQMK